MAGYSLISCVVNIEEGSKALRIAHKYGALGGTISVGRSMGTSHVLDVLGLDEVRQEIVTMVVESGLAAQVIQGVSEEMGFRKPHHGMAFSLPVEEFIGTTNTAVGTAETGEVRDAMYQIIYVIVEKGKAEDVIDAANEAGARGGTIINARGAGLHDVKKVFSVEIEPEREEVLLIVKAEVKDAVVAAINSHLKIEEPGNGVLFVMPLDEVYGLH